MIHDVVRDSAGKYPENIALRYKEQSISYSNLHTCIQHFSQGLHSLGVKHGEKILLFLPNCPEFVIGFFGVSHAGCAAVLADIKYNEEIKEIIAYNEIRFVITGRTGMEKIRGLIQDKAVRYVLAEEKDLFYPSKSMKPLYQSFAPIEDITPHHISMILYTSGSTGHPKGVMNSHRTLEEALKNYTGTLPINDTDKLVAVTPFFHSYAFGSCLLAGLSRGATLLLQDVFLPRQILKLITKEKATIFHGVPYMYNLLTQHYNAKEYDLSSMKACISAGAPLTKDLYDAFYRLTGNGIHQEYGSSETGTIALNLSGDEELCIKSVGRALENVSVRILKDEHDEMGSIQVKSLGHSVGYVGKEPFLRDWFRTGDLGIIDEKGFIHIQGREKRIINVAGLKVNPAEVEELLSKHPEVADVYVRGGTHKDFGEIVEAVIVRKDRELSEEEIIRFCQNHLALYKIPRKIKWVPSIPRSGTGKVMNEKI